MATLAGATIASTYQTLIKLDANDATLVAGASGNAIQLKTGDNDTTPIYLNTDRVGIGTASPGSLLSLAGDLGDEANIITAFDSTMVSTDSIKMLLGKSASAYECAVLEYTNNTGSSSKDSFLTIRLGSATGLNIDGDSNVGIGTDEPGEKLHIKGNAGDYATIAIESGSTAHGSEILFADATDPDYGSIVQFASSAGEGGRMRFTAGATETMNLKGGNVGIGTDSPSQLLEVEGAAPMILIDDSNSSGKIELDGNYNAGILIYDNGGTNDVRLYSQGDSWFNGGSLGIGTNAPISLLDVQGGTGTGIDSGMAGKLSLTTAELGIADNDVLGIIQFESSLASAGGDSQVPAAAIWAEAEGTFSSSANPCALVFSTADSENAVAHANERMRISNDGLVGIGDNNPQYLLDVAGTAGSGSPVVRFTNENTNSVSNNDILLLKFSDGSMSNPDSSEAFIVFWDTDSQIDEIRGDGSNGVEHTMTLVSDSRLKKDVTDLGGALTKINKLKPRAYSYTDDFLDGKLQRRTSKPWWVDIKAGFIAQEFEVEFPELVRERHEICQEDGISYGGETYNTGDKISQKMIDLSRDQVIFSYMVGAIQELSAKVDALENSN